ncbi:MAG: tRNA dimethylallyltransferase [Actinomycetota bacterium]
MGPTASGKSALALEIARRCPDVELVSVDSMQVYRGMDIGTAKPTLSEQAEVQHHLIDVADPWEDFTVARFQAAAREVLAGIEARGKRALLVGGTGLYLRAVIDDLAVPGLYPDVRAELDAEPDTAGLHERLATLDPVAAGRTTASNRRRIVRALEVTIGSGAPFSSFGPGLELHGPSRFRLLGLWLPRTVLAERIAARVEAMFAAGLVDEVATLARHPKGMSRTARQALGYKEVLAHLEGGAALDGVMAEVVRRTLRFARRQWAWFRRDPRISWVGVPSNPLAAMPVLLGDWMASWVA